jgi:phage-related protein
VSVIERHHIPSVDPDSSAYGQGVRVLIYGKRRGVYRVLFTIRGETVYVLTVRHSAQRRLAGEIGEDESRANHQHYFIWA